MSVRAKMICHSNLLNVREKMMFLDLPSQKERANLTERSLSYDDKDMMTLSSECCMMTISYDVDVLEKSPAQSTE